jgi:twitching motility protein PilT
MDREKLNRLLRLGIEKGASDIHFQAGNLPLYRFNGSLVELRFKVLAPADTEAIARMLLEGDPRGQEMAASASTSPDSDAASTSCCA